MLSLIELQSAPSSLLFLVTHRFFFLISRVAAKNPTKFRRQSGLSNIPDRQIVFFQTPSSLLIGDGFVADVIQHFVSTVSHFLLFLLSIAAIAALKLLLLAVCYIPHLLPTPDPKIDLLLPETGKLQQADQGPLQQITKRAKCVLASANWFNLNAGWEQQRAGRLFPACARSHQDITSLPTAHFLTASNFRYQSYP